MNILHIDTGRHMRGGQWQALLLMQALHERGHIQHLLARRGSPLLERARSCGIPAGAAGMMAHFPAADVIHAHDARAHTIAAMRFRSIPLVVSRRVAFPVHRGVLSGWKYRRAARYIAVSRYVARELAHAGIPEELIEVVYDGVPLPSPGVLAERRAWFRQRHGIARDAFVAGTITSLREKPIVPLLEAAATKPRLTVLISAEEIPPDIQQTAPGNARFFPLFPDVSPFLCALDVFVHLSENEGLGSAALLAMAHGLPVVASDAGGLPEIVRQGETGLLVNNVVEDVSAALERIFANRAEAAAMGARGRRFVEENATDAIMAARTERIYMQAAGKLGSPA